MTRELFYPGGQYGGDVVKQVREHGKWVSNGARKLQPGETPGDFPKMTPTTPTTGGSGSHNEHSRLSPSSAGRWSRCTAGPALEAANKDKLLVIAVDKVRKLTSYLLTLPKDELKPEEVRAMDLVKKIDARKLKVADLSADQQRDIMRSEGSQASRLGTRVHDWAEAVLRGRKQIDEVPEDFRQTVKTYTEHCRSLCPGGEEFIESKVNLRHSPGDTGTLDYAVFGPEVGYLRDLKNGAGKLVRNHENDQFGLYVVNLIRDMEDNCTMFLEPDYVLNIAAVQPNHHEAEGLEPWVITLKDLQDFVRPIEDAAAKIRSGEGTEFVVGPDTCDAFCPCSGFCEARMKAATSFLDMPDLGLTAEELLEGLPDEDDLAELEGVKAKDIKKRPAAEKLLSRLEYATNGKVGLLDDETLLMLMENEDAITGLIADAKEYLSARVLSGEKIEGLKVVLGREGNRGWKDETEAEKFCINQGLKQDERCKMTLLGPAAIEKIPAIAAKLDPKTGVARTRTRFAQLIERSAAKKVVALASDSRPEVTSDIDEMPDDPALDEIEDYG